MGCPIFKWLYNWQLDSKASSKGNCEAELKNGIGQMIKHVYQHNIVMFKGNWIQYCAIYEIHKNQYYKNQKHTTLQKNNFSIIRVKFKLKICIMQMRPATEKYI